MKTFYFYYLIIFSNAIIFCKACFPNPYVEPGPIITIGEMMEPICDPNPCATLSGTQVTLSDVMTDSSCIYKRVATCDNTAENIVYNGAGPTFPDPQTLTCDTALSQYTYTDGGGMQQPITSIQCTCDPNPCPALTGTLVTVSAPTVDATCVYTTTATCDVTNADVEYNGAGPTFPDPQTLTCDTATSQYTYTDGGGMQQPITTIQCTCDPNPCPALTGTLVTVSAPTVDATCVYTTTATCDVTNADVEYNGVGPTFPDPQTLTCDTALSQYTYTDGGGMQQPITSIQCTCNPNPCPALTGTLVTVSAATVDANCVYTSTATCDVTNADVEYNGGGPTFPDPQTLTCDTTISQYTYTDGGGMQQPITSIQCTCDPNPCPALIGTLVTVSAATVDANCVYTSTATCDVTNADVEYNGVGPTFPDPQILTCDTALSQYTYTDGGGMQQPITSIQCTCDPNPCAALTGTLITVSAATVDANCVYTSTATCDVTNANVEYNGVGPTFLDPQTLTCDTALSQYTYTDGGGMQQPITSIQCTCDLNPCPALTGTLVTLSAVAVDANCVYTTTATCDVTNADVEYNGVGPTFPDPQTLTCDTALSQYTYTDGGGMQQPITSIQCTCDPNPCPALTGTLVTLSPATADANCVYTSTATCDVTNADVQYNGAGPTFPDPQTLTCDTGTSLYEYTDGGGMQQLIILIQCTCDPNPCPALTGAMVTVSAATVDANCVYTATATCDVTKSDVEYNGAGPTFPDPQTLTCDTALSQYTYTDGGGMQQPITSIQCVCDPNPCPALPPSAGLTISAPVADANCDYTETVNCVIPGLDGIQYNAEVDTYVGPEIITCDDVTMQWTHLDIVSNVIPIMTITCVP